MGIRFLVAVRQCWLSAVGQVTRSGAFRRQRADNAILVEVRSGRSPFCACCVYDQIDLQDLGKAFLVEYLTGPLGPGIEKPSKMPGF